MAADAGGARAPRESGARGEAPAAATIRYAVLEVLNRREAGGWAAVTGEALPATVTVSVDGETVETRARWYVRSDSAEVVDRGERLLRRGFVLDGAPLAPVLARRPGAVLYLAGAPMRDVRGDIEAFLALGDDLTLEGWVALPADAPDPRRTALVVGAERVEARAIYFDRPDIQANFDRDARVRGVAVALPPTIWAVGAERLSIAIACDGLVSRPVAGTTREALRAQAADLLLAETDSRAGIRRALTGLEHAIAPGFPGALSGEHARAARRLAETFRIPPERLATVAAPPAPPSDDVGPLRLARIAFRDHSRRTGPVAAFAAVMDSLAATPETQLAFAIDAIPFLLDQEGGIAAVRRYVSLSAVRAEARRRDVWGEAVAAALAAEDGDPEAVAERLDTIARHPAGWTPYACVEHAARRLFDRATLPAAERDRLDAVARAVLAIAEGQNADYFGRAPHVALMRAVWRVLEYAATGDDGLAEEALGTVERVYLYMRDFWAAGDGIAIETPAVRERLAALEAESEAARATTSGPASAVPLERLAPVVAGLEARAAAGNPDARRALLGMWLETLRKPDSPAAACLAAARSAADEPLRMAFAPSAATLAARDPEGWRRLGGVVAAAAEDAASKDALPEEVAEADEAVRAAAARSGTRPDRAVRRMLEPMLRAPPDARERAAIERHLARADLGPLGLSIAAWLETAGEPDTDRAMLLAAEVEAAARATDGPLDPALAAALARLAAAPVRASDAIGRRKAARLAETLRRLAERAGLRLPAAPRLPAGRESIHGDLLVALYTCRAHLDTRVAAIREGWLPLFERAGARVVIVTGDGDGTYDPQTGILSLACGDRYEDLPDKTIALVRWVFENTGFAYLYKVDDDCVTTPEILLGDLEYRRHDYWGRTLARQRGDTNRLWHILRSQSAWANQGIDKSFEPSIYNDGGSGYFISRRAMAKTLEAFETQEGRTAYLATLNEDKLLGDLLRYGGVEPSPVTYVTYQRRRRAPDGMPVSIWEPSFYPKRDQPIRLAHLDGEMLSENYTESQAFLPPRLWPTFHAATLRAHRNQVELVSQPSRLARVQATSDPVVIAVVRNETALLPHFLAHYRRLGIRHFLVVDNLSDDGTREYLAGEEDVILFSAETEYSEGRYGVAWQQALAAHLDPGRWVVIADADEFLVFRGMERRPLADRLAEAEAEGADALPCRMVDFFPDGPLETFDLSARAHFTLEGLRFDAEPHLRAALVDGKFGSTEIIQSNTRHALLPYAEPRQFTCNKMPVLRTGPFLRLSEGTHWVANARSASEPVFYAHLKFHAGLLPKVEAEAARGQHFDGAAEYRHFTHGFRDERTIGAGEPVAFTDSETFCALMERSATGGATDGRS